MTADELKLKVEALEVVLGLVIGHLPPETQGALSRLRTDLHRGEELDRRGIDRRLSLPIDDVLLRAGLPAL